MAIVTGHEFTSGELVTAAKLNSSVNDADVNAAEVTATGSTTARTLAARAADFFNVKDWGATGDDSTDDTAAIQAAIDAAESAGGGTVYFPEGIYRIARTVGINDRWGIKIDSSNVSLRGETGSKLRRYNTDISTYALAYPILFVGVADDDSGSQTTNIVVINLEFVGESTMHSTTGSDLHDFRTAIEFKNTSRTDVKDCTFTAIDSRAISFQKPDDYNYATSTAYNTTKNYKSEINGNKFLAASHSSNNRAYIHAVSISGIDEIVITSNVFEWCDNAVSGSGTYDDLDDVEGDTYVGTVGAVKRCGKGWIVAANVMKNSSEHALYLEGMDVTINANAVNNDNVTVCGVGDAIKIRSRNCSCTGNTLNNYILGIGVHEPAFNVTISGNTIATPAGTSAGGIIDVNADTLPAYIAARPYLNTYYSVGNVSITGNTIQCPRAGTGFTQIAFRIYTASSTDASYPDDDTISGITIRGNTIRNYRYGVYVVGILAKSINVAGNTFDGKPFKLTVLDGAFTTPYFADYSGTVAGTVKATDTAHGLSTGDEIEITGTDDYNGIFSVTKLDADNFYFSDTWTNNTGGNAGGAWQTTINWRAGETDSPVVVEVSNTTALQQLSFMDNRVYGANYLFASYSTASDSTGAGGSATIHLPWGCVSNSLWFIENFKTQDMRTIDHFNAFTNNTGRYFRDRTWDNGFAVGNMLGDATDNSFRRTSFKYNTGTNALWYYYDDDGNYRALN